MSPQLHVCERRGSSGPTSVLMVVQMRLTVAQSLGDRRVVEDNNDTLGYQDAHCVNSVWIRIGIGCRPGLKEFHTTKYSIGEGP